MIEAGRLKRCGGDSGAKQNRGVGSALEATVAAMITATAATMTAKATQQEQWLPEKRQNQARWSPRRAQRRLMAGCTEPPMQQSSGVVEGCSDQIYIYTYYIIHNK